MNPRLFIQSKYQVNTQAFTLVEITLALGIVAFAMLVTLGMSSTAQLSFSDTRRATVYANILQYVNANANLTPFKELKDNTTKGSDGTTTVGMDGKTWGFDSEGRRVDDDPSYKGSQVYKAQIAVNDAPVLPYLAVSGVPALSSPSVKSVDLTITDSGTTTVNPAKFHILIGDLGK